MTEKRIKNSNQPIANENNKCEVEMLIKKKSIANIVFPAIGVALFVALAALGLMECRAGPSASLQ